MTERMTDSLREELVRRFAHLHGHNDDSPDIRHPIFIMCANECIRQMEWAAKQGIKFETEPFRDPNMPAIPQRRVIGRKPLTLAPDGWKP